MSDEPVWTLDTALALCRDLEPELAAIGYHVGLRGGVLLRGESSHDLDLIVYPHDSTKVCPGELRLCLRRYGLVMIESVEMVHARWRARGGTDRKHVELWRSNGRWVDILFV